MPCKTAVAVPASFDLTEEPIGTSGSIEKTLERMRGERIAGRRSGGRNGRRNLLRADDGIPRGVENRKNVIAKTMFGDGYLPGEFQ